MVYFQLRSTSTDIEQACAEASFSIFYALNQFRGSHCTRKELTKEVNSILDELYEAEDKILSLENL